MTMERVAGMVASDEPDFVVDLGRTQTSSIVRQPLCLAPSRTSVSTRQKLRRGRRRIFTDGRFDLMKRDDDLFLGIYRGDVHLW